MKSFFAAGVFAVLLSAASCSGGGDRVDPLPVPEGNYGITVGGDNVSTRAELGDDRVFRWSPGDKVGMYIAANGGFVANNIKLTSANTEPSAYADFEGEMSESQIGGMAADGVYDYYSYYPYNAATVSSFPNLTVNLPAARSVKPDVLDSGCELMIARATGRGPITYLDGDEQKFGDRISFSYSHVFSYAEIYLACNLMSQRITRIRITDNDGGALAGDCVVNVVTGEYTMTNVSSTVTIDIEGGFDVLDGRIYLPVPAADLRSHTFKVELTTEHGNTITMGEKPHDDAVGVTIPGGNFQKGKVHKLGLKVPFRISFEDRITLEQVGLKDSSPTSFDYKGYAFGGNGNQICRDNHMEFPAYGGNLFGGGDVYKDNDKRAMLRLPAMNMKNTAGRPDIPVQIQVRGNGGSVIDGTMSTYRRLHYASVGTDFNSYLDGGYPYVVTAYSSGLWDWDYTNSGTGSAVLTESKPCVALHYIGNYVALGIKNVARIKEIWLFPKYDE